MDIMVLGVAGGTGSGKTTLTRRLKERFGDQISVISHDNYYKRQDHLTYDERCRTNYDHPDAFDTDLLCQHILELKAGPFTARYTISPNTTVQTICWKSSLRR